MKKRLGILLAATMLVALSFSASATAGTTLSATFPGNDACGADDTKIDPVVDGTYALTGGGSITITVSWGSSGGYSGWTFSFETDSSHLISSIVVKGGPNYHLYSFVPAVHQASGLHAPINWNNKNFRWYGLSHLCITSDKKV